MRMIVAALVLLLTGAAQAQLRSPSLSDTNEKARKAFAKQNEKARQTIVIPEKPSNLRPEATAHPTAARDALETACKKAAADSKMVFLRMGAPPCGGCVAFDHYHDIKDVHDILTKYYVIVDIDPVFMPDGRATFSKYAEIGFPAWVILTPQKKVVVNSTYPSPHPGGRVRHAGFPLAPEEMAHYVAALRKATPAITETELRWLGLHMQKAADMKNPWKKWD